MGKNYVKIIFRLVDQMRQLWHIRENNNSNDRRLHVIEICFRRLKTYATVLLLHGLCDLTQGMRRSIYVRNVTVITTYPDIHTTYYILESAKLMLS